MQLGGGDSNLCVSQGVQWLISQVFASLPQDATMTLHPHVPGQQTISPAIPMSRLPAWFEKLIFRKTNVAYGFLQERKNKPRFSLLTHSHIHLQLTTSKKKKILGSMTVQLHYGRNLFSYYSLFSCGCMGACTQIFVHLSSSNEHISYPEVKLSETSVTPK